MYDPTVFDNLKVAFENQLYDLDTLDETIQITGRKDTMEMSVMGRAFSLAFHLTRQEAVSAELRLEASLKELAAELLELPGETPGCELSLIFHMRVKDFEQQCPQIEAVFQRLWPENPAPVQTLSFVYAEGQAEHQNEIKLLFKRKINEEQMEDIPGLLEHVLLTLRGLGEIYASSIEEK
ncbi:hypothetical protein SAMN04487969_12635 [Paenibacillus algorifonticola]|uniref:Uncharacterized protein n=1 Tax=Paenibacillus algorifonticola TaxID=684063 RepID=A0A1I2HR85_9BACL|nr:hypothetical protein [Paenibacillus algorifonticola]SFF32644.1 hypothetical protein SAMN04487969_12635 [Paenibacillus algorifonticola]